MIKALSKFILNRILGWKVLGTLPKNKKFIIAVVPHSSYFDLIVAVLTRTYMGLKIKFIGKKELFNPLIAPIVKYIGGIPIDREKSENTVNIIVDLFSKDKIQILAVAPEGTRKEVKKWKTGFYYISLKANLPIHMVSFNYFTKQIIINDGFYPTGNIQNDLIELEKKVSDDNLRKSF